MGEESPYRPGQVVIELKEEAHLSPEQLVAKLAGIPYVGQGIIPSFHVYQGLPGEEAETIARLEEVWLVEWGERRDPLWERRITRSRELERLVNDLEGEADSKEKGEYLGHLREIIDYLKLAYEEEEREAKGST